MKIRKADHIEIVPQADDVLLAQELQADCLRLYLTAEQTPMRYLRLRWDFAPEEKPGDDAKVLGDAWERSYGNLEWRAIEPERCMPWVCALSNGSDGEPDVSGRLTCCYGVKVQPGAFCMWQVDHAGVTLQIDVRNGGEGVLLQGRRLGVCDIVFAEYRQQSAFSALKQFYRLLSPAPLPVPFPVYGSNNWYYAYGKSSHDEILSDSALVARLCGDQQNPPFMVVDDGWQPNSCDGPWDRGNERFPDMGGLAREMARVGVRPGIWVRPLSDKSRGTAGITPDMRSMRDPTYLDPSHPDVLRKVAEDTRRFTGEWGYQLVKYDFVTYDVFGFWSFERPGFLAEDGWHFHDRTKTSAEIILALYRTIHDSAAPGAILLGCNAVGHLCAGLAHLNRTGDDTSGLEWERTRKMGVNTLAFRMPQHHAFFDIDADCVGITGQIDWRQNGQWLRLLACSGTPLFVSCKPSECAGQVESDLLAAFARGAKQADEMIPLDWMENRWPQRWLLNGEEVHFDW